MPRIPVGYPPIMLTNMVAPQEPGRLNSTFVIGPSIFSRILEIPDFTTKVASTINGNSDGISTSEQNVSPNRTP